MCVRVCARPHLAAKLEPLGHIKASETEIKRSQIEIKTKERPNSLPVIFYFEIFCRTGEPMITKKMSVSVLHATP